MKFVDSEIGVLKALLVTQLMTENGMHIFVLKKTENKAVAVYFHSHGLFAI